MNKKFKKLLPRPPGWLSHSLGESVSDTDDFCTNQSDNDTQEESGPKARLGKATSVLSTVI